MRIEIDEIKMKMIKLRGKIKARETRGGRWKKKKLAMGSWDEIQSVKKNESVAKR